MKKRNKPAHNRADYSGLKTEYLTAIKFAHAKNHRSHWWFKCICGKTKIISAYRVKNNIIKSCGCILQKNKADSYDKRLIHVYKKGAKNRGIKYTISDADFIALTKKHCYYCNTAPKDLHKGLVAKYYRCTNGVDRIDSIQGYSKDNCVSCCKICNKMKMDLSVEDFIKNAEKIYKHTLKIKSDKNEK